LISQSGNFGLNLNFFAKKRGLGFSKWISFGNQADILFHEYLDYVKDDPNTRVILMYMEGLKNGREFLKVAKETTKSKPVIVLKTGTSAAGTRSAASHTGALAGSNEVYDAAFKQAGIIRVDNSYELLDVGEALAKCPLPKGNRIAILSDGGGDATMAADAAEREGLEIPSLSKETQEKLSEVIPIGAVHSLKNPVDFASEADLWCFANCSKVLLEDTEIDGVVICGGFGSYKDTFPGFENVEEKISPVISQLQRRYNKPVMLESNFFLEKPKSLEILSEQGVPVYGNVEIAVKGMSCLVKYRKYLDSSREDKEEPVSS
jgi:acetyltransferase